MRYFLAIVAITVLVMYLGDGFERAAAPPPSPVAVTRVAAEPRTQGESADARHVYSPPMALDPFRPTALPSLEQPVSPDWGYVVDAAALGWLPRSFLLKEGDAILEINGDPITSSAQVVEAVRGTSEGSSVQLRVRFLRNGDTTTFWASN